MKKVLSALLAVDFAIGALSCGIQKAEERTVETRTAIEQRIKEIKSGETTTKESNPYIVKDLGTFSFTFYVPDETWGYSTATGVRSQHLSTCAVDPKVIPYGSIILVEGNNGQMLTLKCVDCGGGIKGNKIDIFFDSTFYGGGKEGINAGYKWMTEFGTIHKVYLLEE